MLVVQPSCWVFVEGSGGDEHPSCDAGCFSSILRFSGSGLLLIRAKGV